MSLDKALDIDRGDRQTFLASLFQKLSFALEVAKGDETAASVLEVRRQIREAVQGGRKGVLSGEGVTKSGGDD